MRPPIISVCLEWSDNIRLAGNEAREVTRVLKGADVENGLEDTERGQGKLGRSERVACSYIHYQM